MKKTLNFTAFIFIIYFVSSWDNNYINFRDMMLYIAITLNILLGLRYLNVLAYISRRIKRKKKKHCTL